MVRARRFHSSHLRGFPMVIHGHLYTEHIFAAIAIHLLVLGPVFSGILGPTLPRNLHLLPLPAFLHLRPDSHRASAPPQASANT